MFLFINIFCDPSLELSHRGGSNEGSQHMFLLGNKKNVFELSSIRRGGDSVVDHMLDYQSRDRKIDPPLLQSFG